VYTFLICTPHICQSSIAHLGHSVALTDSGDCTEWKEVLPQTGLFNIKMNYYLKALQDLVFISTRSLLLSLLLIFIPAGLHFLFLDWLGSRKTQGIGASTERVAHTGARNEILVFMLSGFCFGCGT
jgi:hypothetical protein